MWPQANGQCENFNRNLVKVIRNSKVSGVNWNEELNAFLKAYRSTPHSSTGVAPASLIFINPNLSRLPRLIKPIEDEHAARIEQAREKDGKAKQKMKAYADKRRRARENSFEVGDRVLLRQNFGKRVFNKTDSLFAKRAYTIEKKRGTLIEAMDEQGNKLVRNAAFFKLDARKRYEDEDEEEFEPLTRRVDDDRARAEASSTNEGNRGELLGVDATGEVNFERERLRRFREE